MPTNLRDFHHYASPILGALAGFLIAVPLVDVNSSFLSPIILIAFGFFGAAIGYKRRKNASFFYFALVTSLILITLLLSQIGA